MSKAKEVLGILIKKSDDSIINQVLNGWWIETSEQEGEYRDGYLLVNGRMVEFNSSDIIDIRKGTVDDKVPENPVLQTEETMKQKAEAMARASEKTRQEARASEARAYKARASD